MTTPIMSLREMVQSQSQPHLVFNEAVRRLEASINIVVVDKDLNAPPTSPAANARYIVGSSPTGAWSGQAGKIAFVSGTSWLFLTPYIGWRAWVTDESQFYRYNGSTWGGDGSGSSGDLASSLQFSADISPSTITGNQNDYNPSGLSTANTLRLATDAPRTITGIAGGSDGRILVVHNVGANTLVLASENAGSTAANRFLLAADITMAANEAVILQYDSTSSRWRAIGRFSSGVSSGALATEILADSPVGYWKCDETSGTTLVNSGSAGTGYNMTLAGTYTLAYAKLVPNETTDYLLLGTGSGSRASVAGTLGVSVPFSGDYTIEAVICPLAVSANSVRVLSFMATGETEAANYQAALLVGPASTGVEQAVLNAFWEYSAGTNLAVAAGNAGADALGVVRGHAAHVAIVKNGTANTVDFYVNGRRVWQESYSNEPTGGSDAGMTTYIGADAATATGSALLGHVAFYTSALSAARIRAHARAAGFV